MKEFLIETFLYNDATNKKLLGKIRHLEDKWEAIRLISHLIRSQYKWMARIVQDPAAPQMSWWDPPYKEEELEEEWTRSLGLWLDYIQSNSEEALCAEVTFTGFDGGGWAATPKDIALQLNFHSIHHRAHIQTLIRQQGVESNRCFRNTLLAAVTCFQVLFCFLQSRLLRLSAPCPFDRAKGISTSLAQPLAAIHHKFRCFMFSLQ